ncbi:sulfotransferase family protein [Paenibacillus sp. PAMC 26794]|uniref:sulfotransferase-like domain-containing protein n=1 Tax=Paenibacillus sp. PAMC 26794 TaxID=1257080 RepID=UPI0002E9869D|nr:sulfotransferase family protein [Paenibacillus sp. PAMC 26794]
MNKIIALWAIPRSVSTAFERIFIERGDFTIVHEPFSVSYYYSFERCSNRYSDVESQNEFSFSNVLANLINSSSQGPLFLKDMAYHLKPKLNFETISNFENTFIIRHPKYVLPSLYAMLPDFNMEEAGYQIQYELFQMATQIHGENVIVIDADDLCDNPQAVVKAYCKALDIPFIQESLSWKEREVPEWDEWKSWHLDALSSTSIRRNKKPEEPLSGKLLKAYNIFLPIYEEMYKFRLIP